MPSRPHTAEEMREMFLRHILGCVRWWEDESRAPTPREKLEGLTHSILAALDGSAVGLPAFDLVPQPHSEDRTYHIERGENYWPDDVGIHGDAMLAYQFSRLCRPEPTKGEE